MSQSAVSNALNRLRYALGDDLFVRQGNQLVPTDFASSVKDALREELNRLEDLLTQAAPFDPSQAVGNFKISASDFFAELLMLDLAELLSRNAPGITAQLVDLLAPDHVGSVERQGADLALIPDTKLPDHVMREPLFYSSFSVIGRTKNPALQDLETESEIPMELFCAGSHVVFSPEGKRAALGDSALEKVGRKRHVAMTLPVFSGVCRAVSESDLIALVPRQLAQKVAPDLKLKIFHPPFEVPRALIVAIWPKRTDANPLTKWMRQQVFDLMKPLNDW